MRSHRRAPRRAIHDCSTAKPALHFLTAINTRTRSQHPVGALVWWNGGDGRRRSDTGEDLFADEFRLWLMSTRIPLAWLVFGVGAMLLTVALVPVGMRLDLEPSMWWRIGAVMLLGIGAMAGAVLYLTRSSGTIRTYFTQLARATLVTGVVASIPLWIMAASYPSPWDFGLVAVSLLLFAIRGLNSIRCPRCKGFLSACTALALALAGIGGHTRIDSCESCHVLFDDPRDGPRRLPIED